MALPARILILSAALLCASMAWAAPRRSLDRARIHALYHDGEFERILRELEPYGKGQCACVKDDSIFAEKHLAVVLAAAPATRELGRYHMFRLLDLSPRADLLDMYVGDEVDAVFEKVRKEHDLRASDSQGKTPAPASAAIARTVPVAPRKSSAPLSAAPATAAASIAAMSPASHSSTAGAIPAAPPSESSEPAYSDDWTLPARVAVRPRGRAGAPKVRSAVRPQAVPAKPYRPWDAPLADHSPRASGSEPARAPAVDSAFDSSPSRPTVDLAAPSVAGVENVSESDTSNPVWKKPGVWIGGGAAIAAIAFTLWHAGSESGGPGKTYAVPASLSKSP
ncbi:MAG: hypothetical protein JF616_00880 [Fibrobacteres bacterium]|nr:hypothetical protein [Fibrobacterota bacterium]